MASLLFFFLHFSLKSFFQVFDFYVRCLGSIGETVYDDHKSLEAQAFTVLHTGVRVLVGGRAICGVLRRVF